MTAKLGNRTHINILSRAANRACRQIPSLQRILLNEPNSVLKQRNIAQISGRNAGNGRGRSAIKGGPSRAIVKQRLIRTVDSHQIAAASGSYVNVFPNTIGQARNNRRANRASGSHIIDFARAGNGKHFCAVAIVINHQGLDFTV